MAATGGSQVASLCAVASFLWLSSSVQNQPLVDQPRLSSALVLFISGAVSYFTGYASRWLPGANGRFDEGLSILDGAQPSLPKRPRRYFQPALVAAVVVRLELFHVVNADLQCSVFGVEYFLPLLLIAYEVLPGRRPRSERQKSDDTLAQTTFEDFDDWAELSKPFLLVSGLVLTYGAYRASVGGVKSTVFCSAYDPISLIFWAQLAGLVLDAVIVVLLWRVLAWTRSTKTRLRTLGGILVTCAQVVAAILWLLRPLEAKGFTSLYIFDVIFDGLVFALFCISSTFVICDGNPSALAGMIAFVSGCISARQRIALSGTWESVRRVDTHIALLVLSLGFSTFAYASGLRSILYIRRAIVILSLAIFFVGSAIFVLLKGSVFLPEHPLERLIYNNRVEADRWLVHASVSKTLKIAVQEYQERNHGREPPPKFDIWYKFAMERQSPIIDHFEQIGQDILPFWGLPPEKIREGMALAAKEPDMAIVKVQDGVASHDHFIDSPYRHVLDDLVGLIKPFSVHLPNLQIAVNLNDRPRVLVPWDDVQRYTQAGLGQGLRKLLSRRSLGSAPAGTSPTEEGQRKTTRAIGLGVPQQDPIAAEAFRRMTALTCPSRSTGRSGVHWNIRDFCSSCAKPHSEGPFLKDWDVSLDLCHQPDLSRLHGFHITPPKLKPLQQLVPVFSRSKTGSYNDILIPLRHRQDVPEDEAGSQFMMKYDKLFWRGEISGDAVSHELLHGGHQERLVHLVNNSTASDKATILLPSPNNKDKEKEYWRFVYELAPVPELAAVIPVDVAISQYTDCKDANEAACSSVLREFGTKPNDIPALKHKYVLLTDSDNGPPVGTLAALRSTSVPFLASVFREWFSERLMPWEHFVPVDLRYHGLFSTLSYFTGLKGRGEINGRDPDMDAKGTDAMWIADRGRRWAEQALRTEDMEVYLFRVLLEYGRLVDDRRHEIGFVLT